MSSFQEYYPKNNFPAATLVLILITSITANTIRYCLKGVLFPPQVFVNPRVLVCIAAHYEPNRIPVHLAAILAEYRSLSYAAWDVTVHVDTDAEGLLDALGPEASAMIDVLHVWSLKDLDGDPFYLPRQHRFYVAEAAAADAFDYMVYCEDDILVPAGALKLFAERGAAVASLGWALVFCRAELWEHDGKTKVAIDMSTSRVDPPVYADDVGWLYSEPDSPYAAAYALDAATVRELSALDEPSGVWLHGFPPFDQRERFGVGAGYALTGGIDAPLGARGWRSSGLLALTPNGDIDPMSIVIHLSSRYANNASYDEGQSRPLTIDSVFQWSKWPPLIEPLRYLPSSGGARIGCGTHPLFCLKGERPPNFLNKEDKHHPL